MSIQHLAYLSCSSAGTGDAEVRRILEQSRRNNPGRRITGHLQCHGGYFFQVLEGPGPALDLLLDTLTKDPRHTDLCVLYREPATRRNFANWSMGYGPCLRGEDQALEVVLDKLRRLRDGPPHPASRVLGVFLSLLVSTDS
jgi:hypothetical protein